MLSHNSQACEVTSRVCNSFSYVLKYAWTPQRHLITIPTACWPIVGPKDNMYVSKYADFTPGSLSILNGVSAKSVSEYYYLAN